MPLAMKTLRLSGLLAGLLILAQASYAQEPALAEKIQNISPDKKFAMRIRYDAEMYRKMFPAEKSDAGKASAELPWDGTAEQTSLTWSRDSKWCAFYASTARRGLTWVYHLRGDKFIPVS